MKIIIAPNAYKGTLTAQQVADAIRKGLSDSTVNVDVELYPVADGGDGSLPTVLGIGGGYYENAVVAGPRGWDINCRWGVINAGKTMFIETALIYGLVLLPQEHRNPYFTTSRGIGEAILKGLRSGVRDFLIGVGGSANNDAGTGMLKALGCSFLDAKRTELPDGGIHLNTLHEIDTSKLDKRVFESKFTFLSDSSVPLVGEDGVSIMYSEGKGATTEMARELDKALRHYSKVFFDTFGFSYSGDPGSGSGGGVVSAGQHFLNADMQFGSDYFIEIVGLEESLKTADLVITGEGMVCEQTIYNKAPISVAKLAKKYDLPVISVNALLGKNYEVVFDHGIDVVLKVGSPSGGLVVSEDISRTISVFISEYFEGTDIKFTKRTYCYD
ncbi:glycerate kinase [Pseudomonadales bacterium]|nr:glycerate kinase [Pseudomonadales bacterium]